MEKFYGDIERINCKYLLEATPFRIDPKVNFSHQLDEEVFFAHLYQEATLGTSYKENELFNCKISDALKDINNIYAKVEMIHIAGYGGCGKTTFVRHLLWEQNKKSGLSYEVIDYEGYITADDPLLVRVSSRVKKYNCELFVNFIDSVAKEKNINMNRFHGYLGQMSQFVKYLEKDIGIDEFAIKQYLRDQGNSFKKKEDFLEYILVLDFIVLLYEESQMESPNRTIILIDNVDSLSDLHEESMLISAIKEFITNCNFFFGQNINDEGAIEGKNLNRLIESTKLVFFLTTRIATIKRYSELYPDLENLYGWNSLTMPEHYYSHSGIIDLRINYYLTQEDENSEAVGELMRIKALAEVAYSNYNFKRLFNGNIRFCIERLCDIVTQYGNSDIMQQCLRLYKMRNKIAEAMTGANGLFLAMILTEFKNNGVYRDKLQLRMMRYRCQG